jgi:uncharacterized protein
MFETMSLISILTIIFIILIYGLISFYIGYNGWVWLRLTFVSKYKWFYTSLVVFLAISPFAGFLEAFNFLKIISGIWMVILAYSLILLPLVNILVYFMRKKGVFWVGLGVISLFLFVFIYGSFNAWSPVVRTYDIEIDKKSDIRELKILMASDLHLGSVVGRTHLERLLGIVDSEKPDIVLIAGDIIDDNIEPYLNNNLSEVMKKIKAPSGVYAVLGNHDYYGNDVPQILEEMDRIGIYVLMDEFVDINQNFYLAGRKEHTDKSRGPASEFLKGVDPTKPLIMMDHQPRDLAEAKENGVDILLSGHTHRGQLFPANLITDRIYENDWGYLRKGNFHSFVSSGFGTWGPPFRIGTRSEVMVINVKFLGK